MLLNAVEFFDGFDKVKASVGVAAFAGESVADLIFNCAFWSCDFVAVVIFDGIVTIGQDGRDQVHMPVMVSLNGILHENDLIVRCVLQDMNCSANRHFLLGWLEVAANGHFRFHGRLFT